MTNWALNLASYSVGGAGLGPAGSATIGMVSRGKYASTLAISVGRSRMQFIAGVGAAWMKWQTG